MAITCETERAQISKGENMTKAKTGINWEEIEAISSRGPERELPDGGVTIVMIQEKFEISRSAARDRLKKLIDSDQYEEYWHISGGQRVKAAVPVV